MPDAKPGELPPLPDVPRRELSAPSRGSGEFEIDAKTPAKSHTVLEYRALISVFDALSPAARLDFTELCDLWLEFGASARRRIIDRAKQEAGRL